MVSTKNKSEEKDIKLTVFYRKMVFFSSFCGNLINLVAYYYIIRYNSSEEEWKIESKWFSQIRRGQTSGYPSNWNVHQLP